MPIPPPQGSEFKSGSLGGCRGEAAGPGGLSASDSPKTEDKEQFPKCPRVTGKGWGGFTAHLLIFS